MVRGAVAFLSAYWLGWIGRHVIKVLRGQAFAKFLVLPNRFFDATSGGELLSKLTYNVEQVAEATSNVVTVLVRDTLVPQTQHADSGIDGRCDEDHRGSVAESSNCQDIRWSGL
jgi:ABC-type multidrug transport system fused ATPase/permease subunit